MPVLLQSGNLVYHKERRCQ